MSTGERCCCGCCPLREGTFTIVNLDLIGKILYLAISFGAPLDDTRKKAPSIILIPILLIPPILAIIGIIKKKPLLVLIYVVLACIGLVALAVDILLVIVFTYSMFLDTETELSIMTIVAKVVIMWCMHAYFTSVVYRYYKELKNGSAPTGMAAAV